MKKETFTRQAMGGCRANRESADECVSDLAKKLAQRDVQEKYDFHRPWCPYAVWRLKYLISDRVRKKSPDKFAVTEDVYEKLTRDGVPAGVIAKLRNLTNRVWYSKVSFERAIRKVLADNEFNEFSRETIERARIPREIQAEIERSDAGNKALQLQIRNAFQVCLSNLAQEDREIIVKKFVYGFTLVEIAQDLHGKSDANLVSGRYYRARAQVQTCLEQKGFSEERK